MMFNSCLFRECATCWWTTPAEWLWMKSKQSFCFSGGGVWLCQDVRNDDVSVCHGTEMYDDMNWNVSEGCNTLKFQKKEEKKAISLLGWFALIYSTYRLPSGVCEWVTLGSLSGGFKLFGWVFFFFLQNYLLLMMRGGVWQVVRPL